MPHALLRPLATVTLTLAVLATSPAIAEIKTKSIEYRDGDHTLTGYLAWDDSLSGKAPGILVVHEWWGLNAHAKERAEKLAGEGYVAFAADMYGTDRVTTKPDQAQAWYTEVTSDLEGWMNRAQLGLDVLKAQSQVDSGKLAAMGFCFGGTTVMQMAYTGSEVDAVASYHGSLPAPPSSVTGITQKVLAAHGRADPFVPNERVTAFQDGLDSIGADWQMLVYSGTRHSFTNKDAGQYGLDALAYNEVADKSSWEATMRLFDDVFGE